MINATIFEAKTKLSTLLKEVEKGELVIITSGRARTPVAKLEAIQPVAKKRLGALETPGFVLSEKFFEPLPSRGYSTSNEGVCWNRLPTPSTPFDRQ